MRRVSLREFRTRGEAALKEVPRNEVVLLSGQKGPAYYLIPADGDLGVGDRELRRALARMSLKRNTEWAAQTGANLLTDQEIDEEIRKSRAERQAR